MKQVPIKFQLTRDVINKSNQVICHHFIKASWNRITKLFGAHSKRMNWIQFLKQSRGKSA